MRAAPALPEPGIANHVAREHPPWVSFDDGIIECHADAWEEKCFESTRRRRAIQLQPSDLLAYNLK
jgi:hypothetical protein